MKRFCRVIGYAGLMAIFAVALVGLLSPVEVQADAGGGGGGGCNCPPEITLKNGDVCTLIGGCNEPNCYYFCPWAAEEEAE